MKQYVDLVKRILADGEERGDRTGVGTKSVFGGRMEFDLRQSFPLVTIKKTLWRSAFTEMLWFLRGESDTKWLHDHGVKIWDSWANAEGDVGPIYGVQWRRWRSETPGYQIDQVSSLIEAIKKSPTGRRHIVTAWNPAELHKMSLPPCHRDFQCYVSNDGHLDLMWAQRSWDVALGAPFNIAQYALLTHLLARATGLKPRFLSVNFGDAHLYLNHVEPMRKLVEESPIHACEPQLQVNTTNTSIDGYTPSDFDVLGYVSGPMLKLPIAV